MECFRQSLRDLSRPATCATHLLGCVATICGLGTGFTLRATSKRHDFLNLAVSFITTPRTSSQFSVLLSQLAECDCTVSHPVIMALHNTGSYWVDRLGHKTGVTAVLMFQLFLIPGDIYRESNTIRVAKGDNKNWPRSISDVAPFGFDSLVEVMSQWAILLPIPSAFVYLGGALHVCGRPLFTALTSSSTFLDRFIYVLRTTCAYLRRSRPDGVPLHPLWMIGICLCRIILGRTSRNSIEIWVKGREVELYTILSEAVDICYDQQLALRYPDEAKSDLAFSANMFHAFTVHFSKDVSRPPNLHPGLAPVKSTETVDPAQQLRSQLGRLNDTCYAAGCTRTIQEVGHAFRKCADCKYVAYCSRQCQAADWKDSNFPHKTICKQLQIFDAAGGRRDRETFLANFDRSIGDPVVKPLNAWFDACDERKEMEDLLRASQ
ncbi:hypothetical protein C8R47DRAFT_251186 [Mycena vitilis]|nr:hypothetical protein C8R47DRAFT_251186 [Mycena vitilis]